MREIHSYSEDSSYYVPSYDVNNIKVVKISKYYFNNDKQCITNMYLCINIYKQSLLGRNIDKYRRILRNLIVNVIKYDINVIF